MYSKPVAPQSIGQVLDGSFKLFRASWGKVWLFALLGIIIGSLDDIYKLTMGEKDVNKGLLVLLALSGFAASVIFFSAIYSRLNIIATGGQPGGELKQALRRVLRLVLMWICFVLVVGMSAAPLGGFVSVGQSQGWPLWAIIGGAIVLAVLPLAMIVYLFLANALIMIEDRKAVESLRESRRLVIGNWWRTAALLTVGGIIAMAIYMFAGILAGFSAGFMGGTEAVTFLMVSMVLVMIFIGIFVLPYISTLTMVVYYDLKLRKEGGDLAARIDSLA